MGDARDLHPGAWWTWALGLATAAAMTTNIVVLMLLIGAACLVVALRRSSAPWALGFHQYLMIAAAVVVIRVVLRMVLSRGDGLATAFAAGLADGLQLAAMIVCIGAANSLANPKQLLASLPAALHEIGTAVVIALSVFPQLVESVQRVRRARTLRPDSGRVRGLRGIMIPVLEDAFDRSLALAASMEARGFGRSGAIGRAQRRATGAQLLVGLACLCIGMYATLDGTSPRWLTVTSLTLGVLLTMLGARRAGRSVNRTRYRPHRWALTDTIVVGCGLTASLCMTFAAHIDPAALRPDAALQVPSVTIAALGAVIAAMIPAWATPTLARTARA